MKIYRALSNHNTNTIDVTSRIEQRARCRAALTVRIRGKLCMNTLASSNFII